VVRSYSRTRHIVLRDTINHWSHHRGQLTVYPPRRRLSAGRLQPMTKTFADRNSCDIPTQ
jgi:uncharacterized damage-inducible protein DinB